MTEFTQRQNEIIDKAIQLIDQKGIQGLTIKNLARETGVTEGAIYRHFKNKREILSSILIQFKENLREYTDSVDDPSLSSFDKISGILHHFRQIFEANPAIVSIIFAEEIFHNDNELSKVIGEVLQSNQQFLVDVIKQGQNNNEIREDLDTQMIVDSIFGAFRLLVKKWKMAMFDISLENNINGFLDYLKKTLVIQKV